MEGHFSGGLNWWWGISFGGCGLLLMGVSMMGNFVWVELVVRLKFWWLWAAVGGCFSGKYFWLG